MTTGRKQKFITTNRKFEGGGFSAMNDDGKSSEQWAFKDMAAILGQVGRLQV